MADTPHPAPPKLLDDVRKVLRLHHYSIHTERAYMEWIVVISAKSEQILGRKVSNQCEG